MNRIAIKELTDGCQVDQAFRAVDKQLRVNRQGGKYILLKLADRTGVIAGMMWNADERIFESFERGGYVLCRGRAQIHNGSMQIIVNEVERLDSSEIEPAEFDSFDAAESDKLIQRLTELLGGLQDTELNRLGAAYLADQDLMRQLSTAAAAVSNHHAYPGGLLRHTVDMMELCRLFAPRYPQLDGELLMFGAFLHDLGKIFELSGGGEVSYTDRGQLVGHIVIGIQMLGEKDRSLGDEGISDDLRLQLEHLIASHHGQLEYGSPKIPLTLEAVALHHIDNLDAKLASYTSLIEADISGDGNWTNYVPAIGRKLWKKRGAN